MPKRKGLLMLSEARSGTTWLLRMATAANLGCGSEWLQPEVLGLNPEHTARDVYFETALAKATSESSGFFFKIFPQQLFLMHQHFDTDFIEYAQEKHDTALVVLKRRDRLRQAISYARANRTKQYASDQSKRKEPVYDFHQIARCYFHIERGYSFLGFIFIALGS